MILGYIFDGVPLMSGPLGCLDGDCRVHVPVFVIRYAFFARCYCVCILPASTEMAGRCLPPPVCYLDVCSDSDLLRRGYWVAGCSSAEE